VVEYLKSLRPSTSKACWKNRRPTAKHQAPEGGRTPIRTRSTIRRCNRPQDAARIDLAGAASPAHRLHRAARLIEQMERSGMVTEMQTNGNREVLAPAPRRRMTASN